MKKINGVFFGANESVDVWRCRRLFPPGLTVYTANW